MVPSHEYRLRHLLWCSYNLSSNHLPLQCYSINYKYLQHYWILISPSSNAKKWVYSLMKDSQLPFTWIIAFLSDANSNDCTFLVMHMNTGMWHTHGMCVWCMYVLLSKDETDFSSLFSFSFTHELMDFYSLPIKSLCLH